MTKQTFALEDLDISQLQTVYNREAPKIKAPKTTFSSLGEALRRTRKLLKLTGNETGRVENPGPKNPGDDNESRLPTAKPSGKKPRKATGGGGGRRVHLSPTDVITVLVDENPKKRAAKDRFALYKTGMTVKEYTSAIAKLDTGNTTEPEAQASRDISWDMKQGWIKVEGKEAEGKEAEGKKTPAKKPAAKKAPAKKAAAAQPAS